MAGVRQEKCVLLFLYISVLLHYWSISADVVWRTEETDHRWILATGSSMVGGPTVRDDHHVNKNNNKKQEWRDGRHPEGLG